LHPPIYKLRRNIFNIILRLLNTVPRNLHYCTLSYPNFIRIFLCLPCFIQALNFSSSLLSVLGDEYYKIRSSKIHNIFRTHVTASV
jgi:hypothetical protein